MRHAKGLQIAESEVPSTSLGTDTSRTGTFRLGKHILTYLCDALETRVRNTEASSLGTDAPTFRCVTHSPTKVVPLGCFTTNASNDDEGHIVSNHLYGSLTFSSMLLLRGSVYQTKKSRTGSPGSSAAAKNATNSSRGGLHLAHLPQGMYRRGGKRGAQSVRPS